MDKRFFRSRQFAIAGSLAALVLVAGAVAVSAGGLGFGSFTSAGCRERVAVGEAVEPTLAANGDRERRVLAYTLDASAFESASLDLCSSFGDVVVEPTQSSNLTLEVRIHGGTAQTRDEVDVNVAFAREGGALNLAAWQGPAEYRWRTSQDSIPSVTLVVHAPESLVYAAHLAGSSGDMRVSGLRVANLTLDSNFGDVRATDVAMEGDVEARTRSGDVVLNFTSVQTGRILADTRFGEIDIGLVTRADVGYDAFAATRFGSVHVNLGPAEVYENGGRMTGDDTHVRTAGYAEKPTKVEVRADSRSGDIRIVAN